MASPRRWTREKAVAFLRGNENYQFIARDARGHLRAPEDLSTPVLRRYATGLANAAERGEWFPDLAALRGHTATEHHRGRGPKKGREQWIPPERIRRFYWQPLLDTHEREVGRQTITSGEATALKTLKRAALRYDDPQIALNLHGPKPGDLASLWWKGGWRASRVLEAAGYTRVGQGYRRRPDAMGLEKFLLWYLSREGRYPSHKSWKVIALYEIVALRYPSMPTRTTQAGQDLGAVAVRDTHTQQLELWVLPYDQTHGNGHLARKRNGNGHGNGGHKR